MTGRYELRPLRACPPEALAELRARVAALLRFSGLLPAYLLGAPPEYVKLGLLHDDVSAVIGHCAGGPAPRRSPVFTPYAAAAPGQLPGSLRDRLALERPQDAP